MAEQRLHHALAPIDVLTRLDLESVMNSKMDSFIRDWFRGETFVEVNGNAPSPFTGTSFPIAGPDSGYSWSLKTLSVVISAAATVTVYFGDNVNTAPIATQTLTAAGAAVFTWTSNVAVIKDQRFLTVNLSAGTPSAYKLTAKQVPTEMEGKL